MNKTYLSLLSVLALSGCGTIVGGTTQNISIDANVKGVEIFDNGMKLCETPCTVRLSRERSEKTLIARKNGYEDARVLVGTSLNLFTLGNLISYTGFTTDAVTGAVWEYSPSNYYVNMMRNEKESRKEELLKKETRRFILKNYDALRMEARSGKTDYMKTLSSMTKISIDELKKMCAGSVSQILFAEEVAERAEY